MKYREGDWVIALTDDGAPGRFTPGQSYRVESVRDDGEDFALVMCRDDKGERSGQFASRWKMAPASTYLNGHPELDLHKGRFIVAWDDGVFTPTGDDTFTSLLDADKHANELARINIGTKVAVLRVVSTHEADARVTSERE